MIDTPVNAAIDAAKTIGARKIAGEHSLDFGELVAIILAGVIILWGEKIPFVGKFLGNQRTRVLVGLALIFVADWVW